MINSAVNADQATWSDGSAATVLLRIKRENTEKLAIFLSMVSVYIILSSPELRLWSINQGGAVGIKKKNNNPIKLKRINLAANLSNFSVFLSQITKALKNGK